MLTVHWSNNVCSWQAAGTPCTRSDVDEWLEVVMMQPWPRPWPRPVLLQHGCTLLETVIIIGLGFETLNSALRARLKRIVSYYDTRCVRMICMVQVIIMISTLLQRQHRLCVRGYGAKIAVHGPCMMQAPSAAANQARQTGHGRMHKDTNVYMHDFQLS
jgi:hypothetical protein